MLYESSALTESWARHITSALNQDPRWWIKPCNVRVADLSFYSEVLAGGLEICAPQLKIIKKLNVKLVSTWLKASKSYLFVHKFETVTGLCTQISLLNADLIFSGVQNGVTFNLLPIKITDYAEWGVKILNKVLEQSITHTNYRLDHIWVDPSLGDLESKDLLIPLTKGLFMLKSAQEVEASHFAKESEI